MDKATIQKIVLAKRDRGIDYKNTQIKPKDKERLQRYRADKDFYAEKLPNLTAYTFTDTSIMSAVERMTAQIIKMLFGNKDIGSIKGRNADDDANGETMQDLCTWQIEFANSGYQKMYWAIKECLYQLYSVVMITQKREYEEVEEEQQIPMQAAEEFMQQCIANKVDILEVSEGTMAMPQQHMQQGQLPQQQQQQIPCYNVKIRYTKLTANYPLIENVPSEELFWTPGAKTLKECEMVGRRKQVTIDYLVRNIKTKQADGTYTGMYDKKAVMDLANNGSSATGDDMMDEARNNGNNDGDTYDVSDPNRKLWICEMFCKMDINGDKKLEDCIMTVVEEGDIFIRYEENEDGFPFCVISPVFDPYCIVPSISGIDSLGQCQDLMTAIIRLTIQNLALNNNPQQLCQTSSFLDFNQVLDGDQFIDINGIAGEAMQPVAEIPLAPYTLDLLSLVKSWGEEASGVNSYNQGLDSTTMNKTATGITALISQGTEVLTLIMRNISETGLKDMFMRFIYLNQKYIDEDQVVRLTGKDLVVNKENLKGDFDYVVEAGLGAGVRQTDIQNMTAVVERMPLLIQAGIATKKNAYEAEKKLLELTGIKDVTPFLTEPQEQDQPPVQPVSESLRVDFNTLPVEVKIQILAKSGIQATPEMFVQQMQLESQIKQQEEQAKVEASVHGDIAKTAVTGMMQDHHSLQSHKQNMQVRQGDNAVKEREMLNANEQAREARNIANSQNISNGNNRGNQAGNNQIFV